MAEKKSSPHTRKAALIRALRSGAKLNRALRTEIADTLEAAEGRRPEKKARERKRRSVAVSTFMAASLARELVEKHAIKPTRAAKVAFETIRARIHRANASSADAVARVYRKIKDSPDCSMMTPKGDKIVSALISDGIIADALWRLGESDAEGTPPFFVALAHLSKPVKRGNK